MGCHKCHKILNLMTTTKIMKQNRYFKMDIVRTIEYLIISILVYISILELFSNQQCIFESNLFCFVYSLSLWFSLFFFSLLLLIMFITKDA